ncbi:MAG: hypothetical protein ACP5UH_00925 [Candidatus Micrarchaeia archaeon]
MVEYDKEFLEYMKSKYHITLGNATNGTEREIITFAVAWDVWKEAKRVYTQKKTQ